MAAWAAIVLGWNGREDTLRCLESLSALRAETRLIYVDNGSHDGSAAAVRETFPQVTVIESGGNLGFAGGNNLGIHQALADGADWILLVNNDATVAPDCIEAFAAVAAARPDAGALCGKVYLADDPTRIWFAGQRVSTLLGYSGAPRGYGRSDGPDYADVIEIDRAVGAFMAVSRTASERVGLLDEELFAYVEDVEWSLRIRAAGMKVLLVPAAHAWHRVSASTGGERASTHSLYYGARNTIAVVERYRPLPAPAAALRRGIVRATFSLHALRRGGARREALRAVGDGVADARAGRYGERSARS